MSDEIEDYVMRLEAAEIPFASSPRANSPPLSQTSPPTPWTARGPPLPARSPRNPASSRPPRLGLPLARPVSMTRRFCFLALPLALAACSGTGASSLSSSPSDASTTLADAAPEPDAPASTADAAAPTDAAPGSDATSATDAAPAVVACPTTGAGAIDFPAATCLTVTPVATGASALGENATNPSYALAPHAGQRGQLVLFLNGSGGHPADQIASPTKSFFTAAAGLGYHVLAVSYRSNATIASQCACADACYLPTRETVIAGTVQAGAAADVADMRVDESVAGRAALALAWLATNDPADGWDAFLTSAAAGAPPEAGIDWSKLVAAGHSQGGGHAAAIGRMYPVARVVQLSSTCDEASTSGTCPLDPSKVTPASWTSRTSGAWQAAASTFWGLDIASVYDAGAWVSGDGLCPLHAAIWNDEAMTTANENDGASICGATTALQNHDASIACADNFAAWRAMLQ